ncbi:MAG: VOC family protein [Chloroflexota bacterium]
MQYEGIDHVFLPVRSVEEAAAPFERLGLKLSPARTFTCGLVNRVVFVGHGENLFAIELFGIHDAAAARRSILGRHILDALEHGSGLCLVGLRVPNLVDAMRKLSGKGVGSVAEPYADTDGIAICDLALLDLPDVAACTVMLVQNRFSQRERTSMRTNLGHLNHTLPIKRVDHLAAVTHQLEDTTRYWDTVMGVPRVGVVSNERIVLHQLKIGDVMLELIAPASADSPAASRPQGLGSSVSCEVDDIQACARMARAAGFSPSEPAIGTLPGTYSSTIPGSELFGLNFQFLQYIK